MAAEGIETWLERVEKEAGDIRKAVADEVVEHGSHRALAVTLTKLDETVMWAREYVRLMQEHEQ